MNFDYKKTKYFIFPIFFQNDLQLEGISIFILQENILNNEKNIKNEYNFENENNDFFKNENNNIFENENNVIFENQNLFFEIENNNNFEFEDKYFNLYQINIFKNKKSRKNKNKSHQIFINLKKILKNYNIIIKKNIIIELIPKKDYNKSPIFFSFLHDLFLNDIFLEKILFYNEKVFSLGKVITKKSKDDFLDYLFDSKNKNDLIKRIEEINFLSKKIKEVYKFNFLKH